MAVEAYTLSARLIADTSRFGPPLKAAARDNELFGQSASRAAQQASTAYRSAGTAIEALRRQEQALAAARAQQAASGRALASAELQATQLRRSSATAAAALTAAEERLGVARASGSRSQIAAAEGMLASARARSGEVSRLATAAEISASRARAEHAVVVRGTAAAESNLGQARLGAAAATRSLSDAQGRLADYQERSNQTLARGATILGGGLLLGFGAAAVASMRFEKAMSGVAAVSDATEAEMGQLRDSALAAGAATVYSATEAAQAQAELAKAGLSTADILRGGLSGALSLAAAGQLDLKDAATITAQSLNTFNLDGGQAAHVADLLAAGANKSAVDVGQLGDSMRAGGLVARQTGLTLEETVGTLAAFGDNALIGSDAGTSLKTMLISLNPTSKEAAALMDQLGIRAFDAQGQFIGMEAYAGKLRQGMERLTPEQRAQAMATIFGTDAVRAASIVYDLGAEGIADYTKKVNDNGAAQRMAAEQLDNLAGDLEQFKGALETALISSGSGFQATLRGITQSATVAVDAFNALPRPVQTAVTAVGGIAGAMTLAGGGFLYAAPKALAFKASIADMGPKSAMFARGITGAASILTGPWGLALGAGVLALGVFGAKKAEAKSRTEEFTAAITSDSGALGQNTRALIASKLEQEGVLKAAQGLGVSLPQVTEAVMGNRGAYDSLTATLNPLAERYIGLRASGDEAGASMDTQGQAAFDLLQKMGSLSPSLQAAKEGFDRQGQAAGGAATETGKAGDEAKGTAGKTMELVEQQKEAAKAAQDLIDNFTTLRDTYAGVYGSQTSVATAARNLKDQIAGQREEFGKAATSMSLNTEQGLKNRESVLGLAQQVNGLAQAHMKNARNAGEASAIMESSRLAFVDMATAAGFPRGEIEALSRQLFEMPTAVSTAYNTPGLGPATAGAQAFGTTLGGLPGSVATQFATPGAAGATQAIAGLGFAAMSIPASIAAVTSAPGAPQAAQQIGGVGQAAGSLPGQVATSFTSPGLGTVSSGVQGYGGVLKGLPGVKSTTYNTPGLGSAVSGAQGYGQTLGGLPGSVSTKFSTPGVGAAKGAIDGLGFAAMSIPPGIAVNTSAPGAGPTRDQLAAIGRDVDNYPRRAPVEFSTPGAPAAREIIFGLRGDISRVPPLLRVPTSTPGAPLARQELINVDRQARGLPPFARVPTSVPGAVQADRELTDVDRQARGLPPFARIPTSVPGAVQSDRELTDVDRQARGLPPFARIPTTVPGAVQADRELLNVDRQARGLPPFVRIPTSSPGAPQAQKELINLGTTVDRLTGKTIPIVVHYSIKEVMASEAKRDARGNNGSMRNADGSIVDYYADGGMRHEDHVAQIAPAGTMRLWAEPETGGEAYIPLAEQKRSRSKQILSQVAERFGMDLIEYANGGFTPAPRVGPGGAALQRRWEDGSATYVGGHQWDADSNGGRGSWGRMGNANYAADYGRPVTLSAVTTTVSGRQGQRFADGGVVEPVLARTVIPGAAGTTARLGAEMRRYDDFIRGKGRARANAAAKEAALFGGVPYGGAIGRASGWGLLPFPAAVSKIVQRMFDIGTIYGYSNRNIAGTNQPSQHKFRRAADYMVNNDRAKGERLKNFGLANRDKFQLSQIIWYDRIWTKAAGWAGRVYGHPGGGRNATLQHRDHNHWTFLGTGSGTVAGPRAGGSYGSVRTGSTRDWGGVVRNGEFGLNLSGDDERMLSPRQNRNFERLVGAIDSPGPRVAATVAPVAPTTIVVRGGDGDSAQPLIGSLTVGTRASDPAAVADEVMHQIRLARRGARIGG